MVLGEFKCFGKPERVDQVELFHVTLIFYVRHQHADMIFRHAMHDKT